MCLILTEHIIHFVVFINALQRFLKPIKTLKTNSSNGFELNVLSSFELKAQLSFSVKSPMSIGNDMVRYYAH